MLTESNKNYIIGHKYKYYIDNEKIIIQKGIFNISQRQFLIKNVRQSNQHTPIIFRIFKHTNLP